MAEYLVRGESLTALSDAIREQTGDTNLLTLEAMVVTIKNLDFSKTTPINVVPSTASTFTYDGTAKTPVWQNFDSEQLSIGGATSATNAGTHTVYFTPKAGYTWADESVESKEVSWVIEKKSVNVPSQSGTLTYNGNNQTPSWLNYNSGQMTIGGTTSGTNAGSYTATFTPNSNHKWSDGTTTAKSVTWSIAKATGTLSLSATSGTITGVKGTTKTFTVTYNGNATISVASNNTSIATASISGKTVTVKSVATGSATITVSVGSSTNYTTPSSKTYSATVVITGSPDFTYTGDYQLVDDANNVISTSTGNWKIRFLTSGTLKFTDLKGAASGIDVFCVGGGSGGSAGGGGGGYTTTKKNVAVQANTNYTITIGAGGAQSTSGNPYNGNTTSGFGVSAAGGSMDGTGGVKGGNGGSGGGGYTAGNGGSNGGNGASGGYAGGSGQGSTTREFGESGATLYAGGGGAGHGKGGSSVGTGGAGGGGNGVKGDNRGYAGTANTGGGGGGGIYGDNGCGGAGGSGIVVIRNKRG